MKGGPEGRLKGGLKKGLRGLEGGFKRGFTGVLRGGFEDFFRILYNDMGGGGDLPQPSLAFFFFF